MVARRQIAALRRFLFSCRSSTKSRICGRCMRSSISRSANSVDPPKSFTLTMDRRTAAWRFSVKLRRVTEITVEHHPRTMGKSKYGLSRTIKVIFDLMTIKFMASYQTKPLYVFGWAGLLTFAVSIICALFAFLMKFASWPHHADFIQTPLPVLTMVLLVLGVQFFLMGLLAEMLVRTYHESQAKRIYAVRERIGFGD